MSSENAKIDQNFYKALLAVTNDENKELKRLLVDPDTIRLLVDSLSTNVPSDSIGDGTKTVAEAGTAVKLSATSIAVDEVTIQALPTNTGKIAIGGLTVNASTGQGIMLGRYSSVTLKIDDLNKIYIDATVGGEGVGYVYLA